MYKITNETPIEDDIEFIIETFHEPLPEFVEKINEMGFTFFYKYMEDKDIAVILQPLKEKFFLFSSKMLEHIEEEEEKEFPLLINCYNNNTLPENENLLKKITEDHYNFEKEFDFIDQELKNIDLKEGDDHYNEYIALLKGFKDYKAENLEHIRLEIIILEKFFAKMKTLKEQAA